MKIRYKITAYILLVMMLTGLLVPVKSALASQATTYTYTVDENGWYIRTQDAYLPDMTITTLGLNSPQDLYITPDNIMYIADTGNKRIVLYDIDTGKFVNELKIKEFSKPRGVFVTEDGHLYVADPGAKAVFIFDENFEQIARFDKPDTPLFADTNYEPNKVAVDKGGNVLIVSEGVYGGVIQLSKTGDFLGYFTVNKSKVSFFEAIKRKIFTRRQLENLKDVVPSTFSNVFIDEDGIAYTTTMGDEVNAIKKHNTAGGNMFTEPAISGDSSMADIYVDSQGIIFACSQKGLIDVYSKNGDLIFNFGSTTGGMDIAGLFSTLPSIAVDKNKTIWGIDGDKGYLVSFTPTEYTLSIFEAMDLYEKGHYEESLTKWNDVLRLNQMSILAHNGVGKAYFHAGLYKESMEHFKVGYNRSYFSEAFWEVRNDWIQKNVPTILLILVILAVIIAVIKLLDRKKKRIANAKNAILQKIGKLPVIRDLCDAATVSRHPMNRYYELRKNRLGSIGGATALYVLLFVSFMIYKTQKGFIYQYTAVEDMDIGAIVVGFFALLFGFIIGNWLVTSICDGDGTLKQVYMMPAYASLPLSIAFLSVTVLSYGMTYNESFLLTLILIVGGLWFGIVLFTGLTTVHDLTFWQNVKSLLITVIFMIIAVVVLLVVFVMCEELYEFLFTIVQEVIRNVLG